MDIEGLGDVLIEKFVDNGMVKNRRRSYTI